MAVRRIRATCATVRVGFLPLQRRRQLQHLRIGAGREPARGGHQRLESAGPVAADPAVQRFSRDADLVAERVSMGSAGDLAHQLPRCLVAAPSSSRAGSAWSATIRWRAARARGACCSSNDA